MEEQTYQQAIQAGIERAAQELEEMIASRAHFLEAGKTVAEITTDIEDSRKRGVVSRFLLILSIQGILQSSCELFENPPTDKQLSEMMVYLDTLLM